MATVSGRRLEALLRAFDRELGGLERDAIQRLDSALRISAARLEAELRRLYARALEDLGDDAGLLLREARARLLLDQVRAALDITSGANANRVFGGLIGDSFELGARNAALILSAYQAGVAALSSNARLAVAARATLTSARLAHHGQALALRTEELVIDGIVRGRGWSRTAAELRKEVGVTRWKAEQLVRTESVSASTDARLDTYAENGVAYAQWMATMDAIVCPYCAERAGKAYRLEDIILPAHPSCRCFAAPWKKEWQELGLTDDEWMSDHHRETLARAHGRPTGDKPSPFEKAAGRSKAPTPVWSP